MLINGNIWADNWSNLRGKILVRKFRSTYLNHPKPINTTKSGFFSVLETKTYFVSACRASKIINIFQKLWVHSNGKMLLFPSGRHSWKNQNKYSKIDTSKSMSYQGLKTNFHSKTLGSVSNWKKTAFIVECQNNSRQPNTKTWQRLHLVITLSIFELPTIRF